MKKIFKGLAIAVAATAACAGIAVATAGCSTGKNGTYYGEYHYMSKYGPVYGMVVEVKVENNIITNIKDITNTEDSHAKAFQNDATWVVVSSAGNGWTEENNANWVEHESWLMQQYVGWSVADILELNVYTDYGYKKVDGSAMPVVDYDLMGQPYGTKDGYNAELLQSGLLITGATQGSGRLLLAVQDALGK